MHVVSSLELNICHTDIQFSCNWFAPNRWHPIKCHWLWRQNHHIWYRIVNWNHNNRVHTKNFWYETFQYKAEAIVTGHNHQHKGSDSLVCNTGFINLIGSIKRTLNPWDWQDHDIMNSVVEGYQCDNISSLQSRKQGHFLLVVYYARLLFVFLGCCPIYNMVGLWGWHTWAVLACYVTMSWNYCPMVSHHYWF